ncbi:MAG: DUF4838 domain-containing protein [Kiritimatiellae bacterium]|nr:DUF4838 domain-containing protein [Kiritimatiellia bacterium]
MKRGSVIVRAIVPMLGSLCFAASGPAADAPGKAVPLRYDYSRHFREPLGPPLNWWPETRPLIRLEAQDVHDGPAAIRLDTAGCTRRVLTFNFQLPANMIAPLRGKPMVFSGYVKKLQGASLWSIRQRSFSKSGYVSSSKTASAGRKVGEWERLELQFVVPMLQEITTVDFHGGIEVLRDPTVVLLADCKIEPAPPGAPDAPAVAALEPARGPLILVKDGQPAATIVMATNATRTARFAAKELNRHLKLCTGAELPVTNDAAVVAGPTIQIGSTQMTERFGLAPRFHAPDHWSVWRVGDAVALSGGDCDTDMDPLDKGFQQQLVPFGTLYATYEFLERVLGVRWYWPGKLGVVAPRRRTVSLDRAQWSDAPSFDARFIYYGNPNDPGVTSDDITVWWRRMRRGALGGSPIGNHSFNAWPEKFGKTHPEYFKVRNDGSRVTGHETSNGADMGGHVCFSQPGVLKETVADKRERFDRTPWLRYEAVMPGDGDITCFCKDCQAAQHPERGKGGMHSELVWGFVNKAAAQLRQSHPDRFVVCSSYGQYRELPKNVYFEPNVAVTICVGVALPAQMRSTNYRKGYLERIDAWSRKAANLYVWDYWDIPRQFQGQYGAPTVFPRAIHETLLAERGRVRGRVIELPYWDSTGKRYAAWTDWVYDALNVYVAFRLMWDMDRDVDAMLAEFYRDFYGPAAPSIQRFYEEMESALFRPRRGKGWDWSVIWLEVYPPEFVARAMGCLREAERVTRGREPYHARAVKTLEGFAPMQRESRRHTGGGGGDEE